MSGLLPPQASRPSATVSYIIVSSRDCVWPRDLIVNKDEYSRESGPNKDEAKEAAAEAALTLLIQESTIWAMTHAPAFYSVTYVLVDSRCLFLRPKLFQV